MTACATRLIPGYEADNHTAANYKNRDSMIEWMRSQFDAIRYIIFWLILGVVVTLTLFQVHGTLISVAVEVVDNPSLRPIGWTSGSIYGLSRLLWLILGICWLGWIMYTFEHLREITQLKILIQQFLLLLLILGLVYFCSYVVLLILA